MILRSKNIETLILMGHATSGVILSTVRLGAEIGGPPVAPAAPGDARPPGAAYGIQQRPHWTLDYNLVVVVDGCADLDPEVHQLLMEKVIPRQGTVVQFQRDWSDPPPRQP